jgi:Autotransporter beta-domain
VLPAFAGTPYGAVQFQDFHTPAYSETDQTGGGLGLSYVSMNATDVRTELGARFDDPTVVYNKPLILFGRLAWAHDFVSNPTLSAAFEALPAAHSRSTARRSRATRRIIMPPARPKVLAVILVDPTVALPLAMLAPRFDVSQPHQSQRQCHSNEG